MDAEEALVVFAHVVEHECPLLTCAAAPGSLCDTPALWVHLERIQIAGRGRDLNSLAPKPAVPLDRMGILSGYAVTHTNRDSTVLVRLEDDEWVKEWTIFEDQETLADVAKAAFADHLAQQGH